jgi:hypothetical protein
MTVAAAAMWTPRSEELFSAAGAPAARVTKDVSQVTARERRMVESLLGERKLYRAPSLVIIVGHARYGSRRRSLA